ncbi:MAG TPA: RNA polymerase sigma factor [Bryobacteraceae bacterium]|nr:RNA polymerase sigma factor [Bryobacteraceae bacterium]
MPINFAFGSAGESSDSELIEGCRRGSLAAFERVYFAHSPRMKSIAFHMLQNKQDAEDAVQEAFLKIHRSIHGFQGESSLGTWIYRILINCCYDIGRRRKRRAETAAPADCAHHSEAPLRIALEKALNRIGERQRMVFLLFEVEGLKHSEIAGILGVPEGTSRSWLFEAKRELKNLLSAPEARA